MIKATAVGRVTQDPETRTSKGGKQFATFKMAVKDFSEKDAEGNFLTTWIEVVCFGFVVQRTEALAKGLMVAVSGTATVRGYQKQDGTVGVSLKISADDVELCERPRDNGGQQQRPARSRQQASVQAQAPTGADSYDPFADE